MAYNFSVNEDFYSADNQRQSENLRQMNFADMNSSGQASFFDPVGNNAGYYQPSANSNQTFLSEWSPDQYFNPNMESEQLGANAAGGKAGFDPNDFDNEPPLLEELGINFDHIFRKTKCVLNPFAKPHESIVHDEDLAGPLVFCIAYGFSLLLMGKIHFGFIYGITAMGCIAMYSLLNLMSEKGVSAACIGSILGYCLLPMVILSFVSIGLTFAGYLRIFVSVCFVFWCSAASSKLFVYSLNMANQQLLVFYPCLLLYGIFALLNVF